MILLCYLRLIAGFLALFYLCLVTFYFWGIAKIEEEHSQAMKELIDECLKEWRETITELHFLRKP